LSEQKYLDEIEDAQEQLKFFRRYCFWFSTGMGASLCSIAIGLAAGAISQIAGYDMVGLTTVLVIIGCVGFVAFLGMLLITVFPMDFGDPGKSHPKEKLRKAEREYRNFIMKQNHPTRPMPRFKDRNQEESNE
jgi:hypothetical protein